MNCCSRKVTPAARPATLPIVVTIVHRSQVHNHQKAARIEQRDVMPHDADVPGAQNVRELPVDSEHIYLPAQLLCHPSQLENNDRAAAELGIANDVKKLHIHPRGMGYQSLQMPP